VSKSVGRTVLIIIVIGIALLLLWSCVRQSLEGRQASTGASVQVDLSEIVPESWRVESSVICNFDDDAEEERLVVYRYDAPATPGPSLTAGLIGAVIFDSQVNRVPQEPSVESPYRPAFLVPYKLLPDIYTNKGQGYLGETSIQVTPVPGEEGNGCLGKEIVVKGTAADNSNMDAPNFLSIFRWEGEKVGYSGVHFTGDARIQIAPLEAGAITGFTTYDRLNDRSALCAAQPYVRLVAESGDPPNTPLEFRTQDLEFTIDFCYGMPADPYYPEGVVAALLRGGNPPATTPTGNSFLTAAGKATLPGQLSVLQQSDRKQVFSILAITNPGTLGVAPEQGYPCPGMATPAPGGDWWCAREQVRVITDILVGGQPRQVVWTLITVANELVVDDVHWRVNHVEML
jgi:hypothetical protein